jgi:hypothetical protein
MLIPVMIPVPIAVPIAVAIVLVVFISPIALGVPRPGIGVPPPMIGRPAMFASFGEVVTGVVGFGTAIAVVLDRLVKPVVSAVNASLAVVFISAEGGGCAECGKGREGCCDQCGFAEVVFPTMWQVHLLFSPCEDEPRRERRGAV